MELAVRSKASYTPLVEPWFWLAAFAPLVALDIQLAWRRSERIRGRWSFWLAPLVLGLYAAGWVLDELGFGQAGIVAWFAMTVLAAVGVVPCGVAAWRNRGGVRGVAGLNAAALGALAVRVVVFVGGIELM